MIGNEDSPLLIAGVGLSLRLGAGPFLLVDDCCEGGYVEKKCDNRRVCVCVTLDGKKKKRLLLPSSLSF